MLTVVNEPHVAPVHPVPLSAQLTPSPVVPVDEVAFSVTEFVGSTVVLAVAARVNVAGGAEVPPQPQTISRTRGRARDAMRREWRCTVSSGMCGLAVSCSSEVPGRTAEDGERTAG